MHIIRYLPRYIKTPVQFIANRLLLATEIYRSEKYIRLGAVDNQSTNISVPLVFSGFLEEPLGIGRAARLVMDRFRGSGLEIIPHDLRKVLDHAPRDGLCLPGGPGGVWFINANAPECVVALATINRKSWAPRYRIGYWAWETTQAPESWVRTAQWFHEIWAISQFSRDGIAAAFTAAGRPDLVSRLRVQPLPFPIISAAPNRARWGLKPESFVALSSFDGQSTLARKNPIGAVKAWIAAFPQPKWDKQLLIKAHSMSAETRGAAELRELISDRPDIRIIDRKLADSEMESLISSVDLIISLHRSEGFGLPIAEAMAAGIPVLITGFSAPMEFVSDTTGFIVPAKVVPVEDPSGTYQTGMWSEPDLKIASEILREISKNPDLRKIKATNALRHIQGLKTRWGREFSDKQVWRSLVSNTQAANEP